MEIPTTPEFRDHVRRQMMDEAKRQLDRVNGVAGAPREGLERRPLPGSVSPSKLKLVWINPSMTKPAGRRTNRAGLVMVRK